MNLKSKLKIHFDNLVNKIAGEGRLKIYDDVDKTITWHVVPCETMKDFADEKYNKKKQIIQLIIIILLWILPFKQLFELIYYQTHDYHIYQRPAYYMSYFGMALGEDEISFTILRFLIIFVGNYYHSFCKLINYNY